MSVWTPPSKIHLVDGIDQAAMILLLPNPLVVVLMVENAFEFRKPVWVVSRRRLGSVIYFVAVF